MRRALAVLMLAMASWAPAGCSARAPQYHNVVTRWGTYPLDGVLQLQVSSLGLSQMRYELRHVPANRVLISDIGRDTKGWFFVWDDRGRLWAHWADLGTVVWMPVAGGRFERHVLKPGAAWLGDVPPDVAQRLPDWARRSLGVSPPT